MVGGDELGRGVFLVLTLALGFAHVLAILGVLLSGVAVLYLFAQELLRRGWSAALAAGLWTALRRLVWVVLLRWAGAAARLVWERYWTDRQQPAGLQLSRR